MPTVKINTSDVEWLERHLPKDAWMAVAYGTDIKGVMYFTAETEVPAVEHVKFAGASMIRFDLGEDAPRDHNRWAMYPESYLVREDGPVLSDVKLVSYGPDPHGLGRIISVKDAR